MNSRTITLIKRLALVTAAGAALSACAVYAPPYAYNAPYPAYPAYGYGPAYVAPPVSLDFSYHEYRGRGYRHWR
jgi:hypothetical protein